MSSSQSLTDSQAVEPWRRDNRSLQIINQASNSEAAMLSIENGKLEGILHARTLDRRTPEAPASQLHASFIVHGDYRAPNLIQFGKHDHPSFELNLITEGTWYCEMRGVECKLEAGDAILAQPGDKHSDKIMPGTRYRGLRFALHHGWSQHQLLLREGLPPTLHKLTNVGDLLIPHLDRIQNAYDSSNAMCGLIQDAILLQMIWELASWLPDAALHPHLRNMSRQHRHRSELLDCFESHLSEPIGIAGMAQELDISVRSLQDRCQECFGLPPSRAFMRFRLERARQLLMGGSYSVSDVSDELGFSNPFHFSRCYKENFGTPPSKDRSA